MSYANAPTCHLANNQGQPMSVQELETYFGRVEAHYGAAQQCYRLALLRWSETSTQSAMVLDQYGNPAQGVEVIYRLADGGQKQSGFTQADGKVYFQQPPEASYNVPSEPGPMALFIKDQDSVVRCGNVNVRNAPDRHLDAVFRYGTKGQYDPGSTTPPVDPPPIDPPPGGGEPGQPSNIEIRDLNGNLSDWSWVNAYFGPCISIAQQGDWECYKLIAKTGPASMVVTVRDSNDSPVPGTPVVFGWPDGHSLGYTGGAGDVGFGMGSGATYYPDRSPCSADGAKGPHFVNMGQDPYNPISDIVDGLGMKAGTEHDHMEPWYRPRTLPIQPDPPTEGTVLTLTTDVRAGSYRLVRI